MKKTIAALVDALNDSTWASPLAILARPKYPEREFFPYQMEDGSIRLKVYKYGWEYKHRGQRPKNPPLANTIGIYQALNAVLTNDVVIRAVTDEGTYVNIILEVKDENA